jgi:serine/threonine-protein kinase
MSDDSDNRTVNLKQPQSSVVGTPKVVPPSNESAWVTLDADDARPSVDEAFRFQIVEEVARGGMGVVYRVFDPQLQRRLAMKFLLGQYSENLDLRTRFLIEARITGRLQHPGIVPIHDVGSLKDGRPYFVMKLIEGQTLAELLRYRGRGDLPKFLAIFEQICQTVAYAHSQRIIHRDLKPGNIMVGQFGEVQVMDWGLAKDLAGGESPADPADPKTIEEVELPGEQKWERSSLTALGEVVGTPAYMPPEQAAGQRVDERADVFGLGGILCEILTGKPPYSYQPFVEWFENPTRSLAHTRENLNSCGADRELVELVLACLQEDPNFRPEDAREVAARVSAHRSSAEARAIQAEIDKIAANKSAKEAEARARAERKSRRLTLWIGLLLLVLLGGVVGAMWTYETRKQATQSRVLSLLQEIEQLRELPAPDLNQNADRLRTALARLDSAEEALTAGVAEEKLREQVQKTREEIEEELKAISRDLQLLSQLREIRTKRDDDLTKNSHDHQYLAAFAEWGIDFKDEATELAQRLLARPPAFVQEILTDLDDWAFANRFRSRQAARAPILRLALHLDTDTIRNEMRRAMLGPGDHTMLFDAQTLDLVQHISRVEGIAWTQLIATIRDQPQRRWLELSKEPSTLQQPASTLLLLFRVLVESGEEEDCFDFLRSVQQRYPGDLWINYTLGSTLLERHPEEAVRYLSVARAYRPEMGHRLAHALQQSHKQKESENLFRELTRLRPQSPENYGCLGVFLQARNPPEAEILLKRAIALGSTEATVFNALGRILEKRGEQREALKLFERAVALGPRDPDGLIGMGVIAYQMKQKADAVRYFQMAHSEWPSSPVPLFYLGKLQEGNPKEAERYYRLALQADSVHPESNVNLALLLYQQKKYAEAESHLRRAKGARKQLPETYPLLAQVLIEQKKTAEAITILQEAEKQLPQDPKIPISLGTAYSENDQLPEARKVFSDAAKRFPRNAAVHYHYGVALMAHREAEEAIASYRRALELDPNYAEALCNLGLLLMQQKGDYKQALGLLQRGHKIGSARSDWANPSERWIITCERRLSLSAQIPGFIARQTRLPPPVLAEVMSVCLAKDWHGTRLLLAAQGDVSSGYTITEREVSVFVLFLGGQSTDALTPTQHSEVRRIGLTYLHRDFARLEKIPKQAAIARLRGYLTTPYLANVREPDKLEKLDEEEAQAWRRFWAQVRSTLTRLEDSR